MLNIENIYYKTTKKNTIQKSIIKIKTKKKIINIKFQKRTNKNNINNNKISNILFILILILIFILFIEDCSCNKVKLKIFLSNNEITLTLDGNTNKTILYNSIEMPSEIIVNDESQIPISYTLSKLTIGTNTIRIVWESPITSCELMFNDLKTLKNIDLSQFDSSQVTTTVNMFANCFALESINLNNFETSNVKDMRSMFSECKALKSLDLSGFDTSSVTNMENMFLGCNTLKSLDLKSFNTTSVKNMFRMFYWCNNLISLNLISFDTSSVTNFALLFQECQQLTSLNITNFDTSSAIDINNMFYNCYSLKSIDLSNFNTNKVTNMYRLFYGCSALESLDISNFDTSSVAYINEIFYDCTSLKSLDISNFKTSLVTEMIGLFYNCHSLISLELGNLDTSSVTNMTMLFYNCTSLISLNLKSFNTSLVNGYLHMFTNFLSSFKYCINNIISESIKSKLSSFNEANCSELCYINSQNKKFISEKNKCINNCTEDDTYMFEYNNICYSICPNLTHSLIDTYICEDDLICEKYYNYTRTGCLEEIPLGFYLNDSESKTIDKCIIKCSSCDSESIKQDLCIKCNNNANFYQKYNDDSNNESYVNCYNEKPIGYYLNKTDTDNIIYSPCYEICKNCEEIGNEENHKCTECSTNYTLTDGNCIKIVNTDAITTTIIEYDKVISTTNIGYNTYVTTTNIEYNNVITTTNIEYITVEINTNDIIFTDIITDTNIGNINIETYVLNNNTNYYKINSNLTYLKNIYKNSTYIYFSPEQFSIIYKIYNLNQNTDNIYISISDNINNDTKYNYKLILDDGSELNLSLIEEDIYFTVFTPINDTNITNFNYFLYFIEQGYDIYDKDSNFYNDICSPVYLEENDITLEDRNIDFYPTNLTLCKDNCNYSEVDIEDEKIICKCNLNNKNYDTKEDNDDSIEYTKENFFSYLLDNINYKIFKCYKLFIFKNLKNNFAFYTFIILIFILLIIDIIFFTYSVPKLKKILLKDTFKIKMKNNKNNEKNNKNNEKNKMKGINTNIIKKVKNSKEYLNNRNSNKIKITELKWTKSSSEKYIFIKAKKLNKKIDFKNDKINKKFIKTKNERSSKNLNNKFSFKNKIINKKKENKFIKKEKGKNYNTLNDKIINKKEKKQKEEKKELNELPFKLAVLFDKRNIIYIFFSVVVNKFDFIHLFLGNEHLKIILLHEYIFSLSLNFFFNTLLYSDELVSNKYHNNGKLDFVVSLVVTLLSNVITSIICFYLNFSEVIEEKLDLIIEIKNRKYYYVKNIILFFKYLHLKYFINIFIELIIFPLGFYYVIIFCIIYNKSKVSMLKNYATSLIEDIIKSIIAAIIITISRRIGLVCLNKYLYNTSKYINSKF